MQVIASAQYFKSKGTKQLQHNISTWLSPEGKKPFRAERR